MAATTKTRKSKSTRKTSKSTRKTSKSRAKTSKTRTKAKAKTSKTKAKKKTASSTRKTKKKSFGGYAISFAGRKDTMEQVFGKKPIPPGQMTKKIWAYVKAKKIGGKS